MMLSPLELCGDMPRLKAVFFKALRVFLLSCFAATVAGCVSSANGDHGKTARSAVLPPANPLPPGRYGEAPLVEASLVEASSDSPSAATGADKPSGPTASGWIRAYAAPSAEMNGLVAIPDYYESVLEQDVRKALKAGLRDRDIPVSEDGVQDASDERGLRLTYSATVKVPSAPGLRRSRLQIEPDIRQRDRIDQTRIDPISNPGFRPSLSFGPRSERLERKPVVAVSVALVRGDERVWSAFGEAELGSRARSVVARAIVAKIVSHWGDDIEDDAVFYALSPSSAQFAPSLGASSPDALSQ